MLQRRDSDEATTAKKQRVVWSVEMHQQFVAAVNQLGIDSELPSTRIDRELYWEQQRRTLLETSTVLLLASY